MVSIPLPVHSSLRVAHCTRHCGAGVGTPEGVAVMLATHAHDNPVAASCVMTTEAGAYGGSPRGGLGFGAAVNPTALLPSATMLDWCVVPASGESASGGVP